MINKNQYKVRNVKKVLHKVGKKWLVVSTALLGLAAGGTAVAETTHADVTPANANHGNDYANHQMTQSAGSARVHLVNGDVTSAAPVSAQSSAASSVAGQNDAPANPANDNGQAAANSASVSTSSSAAPDLIGQILGNAESIHDQTVQSASNSANQGQQPGLGATPQIPNAQANSQASQSSAAQQSFDNDIQQLMDVIHSNVQSGSNSDEAKDAYSELIDYLDPQMFKDLANANNVSMVKTYLIIINNNGPHQQPILNKLIAGLNNVKSNDNSITTIANVLNGASHDSKSSQYYSNICNDLQNLPKTNKVQQIKALSILSNHISSFADELSQNGTGYLPSQDKKHFNDVISDLYDVSQGVHNASIKLKGDIYASINQELDPYVIGSQFSKLMNRATGSNSAYYTREINQIAGAAKTNFDDASDASSFIDNFEKQLNQLDNVHTTKINIYLENIKLNPATDYLFDILKDNQRTVDDILLNLSTLNSSRTSNNDISKNLACIFNDLVENESLMGIDALNNVSNKAYVIGKNYYSAELKKSMTLSSQSTNELPAIIKDPNALLRFAQANDANKINGQEDHKDRNASNAYANIMTQLSDLVGSTQATSEIVSNDLNNINDELDSVNDDPGSISVSHQFVTSLTNNLNQIQANSQAKSYYSNAVDELSDLPNGSGRNLDLISLADDISGITHNVDLSDNDYLNSVASNLSSTADQMDDKNDLDNVLTALNTSNRFTSMASDLTTPNFQQRSGFNELIDSTENGLSDANASDFISSVDRNLHSFGGSLANDLAASLQKSYNQDSTGMSDAYTVLRNHSGAIDELLDKVSSLDASNSSSVLGQIASTITNDSFLSGRPALSTIASSINSEASSDSASAAYHSFTSNAVPLFSTVVNDITSKGFNSSAFSSLVSAVKYDLRASDDRTFISDLASQLGNFTSETPVVIKNTLKSLANSNNPELSAAYQAVRSSSADANGILDDLSSLTSSNKKSELSNIATVMKGHFSNSTSFGSLADEVAEMASGGSRKAPSPANPKGKHSDSTGSAASSSTHSNKSKGTMSTSISSGNQTSNLTPANRSSENNNYASVSASVSASESASASLAFTSTSASISTSDSNANAANSEFDNIIKKDYPVVPDGGEIPSTPSINNGNSESNSFGSNSSTDLNSVNQSPINSDNENSSIRQRSTAAISQRDAALDVNQLKVGKSLMINGVKVTRMRKNYGWFEVSRTCLAHNTLGSVGRVKDYGAVLSSGMKVRLNKIFKVNVDHRTLYRYEINISGHNYFVTGNHEFTNDVYYQTGDLKGHRAHGRYGHRYFEAIVKKPFMVYDDYHFTKDNQLWKSRRGQLIDIKGVHKVGNVTRLALIDGTYITANREFLKLI